MHIPRERDPNLIKLERDVFSKMNSVMPVVSSVTTGPTIKSVGLEQAMKELLDSAESIDDES